MLNQTNPLLRYGLTTDPFPLQASPQTGNLSTATLTLVVSNPNPDPDKNFVALQGLIVSIPVGADGTDLTPDATGIGPVPPAGWNPPAKETSPGLIKYIFHPEKGDSQVKGAGLNFIFNNVEINRQTGTVAIEVMEGSGSCTPPSCPTQQVYITKFPNGWGEVQFWLDPPDVPYQSATTLHWAGPAHATYSIEYALDNQVFNVPADGAPALGSQGQYPAQTDPPLTLDRTTVFTLRVEDTTISNQTYHAQQQLTATVQIPAPQIISFGVSPTGFSGAETQVTLSWQTQNVSELNVAGFSFSGTEAAQGSVQLTRGAQELFEAEGFGVVGYSGPPATARVCFGHAVSSGPVTLNAPPSTSKTTTPWTLVIDDDRPVFDLNVDAACTGADDWITFRIWLELKPGVEVADLGTSGVNASIGDLANATYSASLPETDIYTYGSYYAFTDPHPHDPSYEDVSYPLPVGATWGVKFSDGKKILVWFEGMQGADFQYPTINFVWYEF
jgi:hypothetical protein